ncbi:hypothetical protein M2352_004490 [Azospirillum fermentarium]|uniref:caspase family protein n=1 Tax=Azospirillum fermentarium TaxID=1233114 RepID=UPI002226672B|nr:caspase family protein [Azospirillum fermentarium]MCW2248830.1 hypothetical protein [Azospirillum fermentarium]
MTRISPHRPPPAVRRMLAAGAAVLALAAGTARAEMAALVIGIDAYRTVTPLHGAVNDARDIADALKTAGAGTVRLLLDGDATRGAVLKEWDALIAATAPDATLVLSYAGHGGQEPERVPGSEADGKDEVLLLAGFAAKGPGTAERITDDELALMLKAAAPRRVIFVADACHSGTMTRAVDPRGGQLGTRAATYGPIEDDALPPPTPAALAAEKEEPPNVTFFAAVPEDELAPEVMIDGQPRGALSWAFARALRGGADRDGDGILSKGELESFIRETVRMKMEGRQHPQVRPAGRGGDALIEATPVPVAPFAGLPDGAPVTLRILAAEDDARRLAAALTGITPVTGDGPALLTWDQRRGEVISESGDMVAGVKGSPADPAVIRRLQQIVDRWSLVERAKAAAGPRPLALALLPDDRIHHQGDKVTFAVSGNQGRYFTLIDLAADGSVAFLYPRAGGPDSDPLLIPRNGPYRLLFTVQPPFGADHFIAITTTQPLPALHADLLALEGRSAATQVARLLSRHLAGQMVELGVHGVYTGPR